MALSAPELTSKDPSFISDLFEEAEVYDACVIFIDEVDAIAKARYANDHYSHLIELIKQMEGIEKRANIFILAATNAPESLDPAFVRSGRIDKRLVFTIPDEEARTELALRFIKDRSSALKNFIYNDNEKERVNKLAKAISEKTLGFTHKDIENVINEGFVLYCQGVKAPAQDEQLDFGNSQLNILYSNIYEAIETKSMGSVRSEPRESKFSIKNNDSSCSAAAIHEVGHALVNILCGMKLFEKITSVPRGYVTMDADIPKTKADFENRIRSYMGGRIAEEIVYGENNISTGASSDIQKATNLAHYMVERVGFSNEFEFMALSENTSAYLGGEQYTCSEAFREQCDRAVNQLLKKLYCETRGMLSGKRELIIALAKIVFEKETMTGEEFLKEYNKTIKKTSRKKMSQTRGCKRGQTVR